MYVLAGPQEQPHTQGLTSWQWTSSARMPLKYLNVAVQGCEMVSTPHSTHHFPEKLYIRVFEKEVCMIFVQEESRIQKRLDQRVYPL